jgi:hypothetical protein
MIFITHRFRVSVVSDVRERVRDLGSPLCFMLRRSSLVECVSVLHGTCLQCVDFFIGPTLVSFNRTVNPYEISKVNLRVETKILVSMSVEI